MDVYTLKIDLTKNGLESIYTPWQITTLEIMTRDKTHTSFTLTEALNKTLIGGSLSRASVIGFMKQLEAWGIIQVEVDKGRGGEYRIYKTDYTMGGVLAYAVTLVVNWAAKAENILSSTKTVIGEIDG